MKAEETRKLADTALEQLSQALAGGRSESLTSYLTAMGRFHRYSFSNVMLIVAQRPTATHVAGFQTWKSLNRFVKKGEKGIAIIAPMMLRKQLEQQGGEGEETILRFRAVHVFDIEQTDGEPLPEISRPSSDPGAHLERLRAIIQDRGIRLAYEDLAGAEGVSCGGTIKLRPGLAPAEEFATLVHELAHEMLHHGEGSVRGNRKVRETEAEAVAFVISSALSLNTVAHVEYIQLYQGDSKTLAESLDRIQRTASAVLADLLHAEVEDLAA